jgi:hypothetical protein
MYILQSRNTWCDYEVPGMILLRDLKGAMQLDCNKDMYMHVLARNSCDVNALTLVVWKLWR